MPQAGLAELVSDLSRFDVPKQLLNLPLSIKLFIGFFVALHIAGLATLFLMYRKQTLSKEWQQFKSKLK